jgi:hypothetical protein
MTFFGGSPLRITYTARSSCWRTTRELYRPVDTHRDDKYWFSRPRRQGPQGRGAPTESVRFREEIVDEGVRLAAVNRGGKDDRERVDLLAAQHELLLEHRASPLHHPSPVPRDNVGVPRDRTALVTPRVLGAWRLEDATVDHLRGGVDQDTAGGQEGDAEARDELAADVANVAELLGGLHRLEAGRGLLLLGGEPLHVAVLHVDRDHLERVVDVLLRLDDRPFRVSEPGAELREAVLLSRGTSVRSSSGVEGQVEVVSGWTGGSKAYFDVSLLISVDRENNFPRRLGHESATFHLRPQHSPVAGDSDVELLQDPIDLNVRQGREDADGEAGRAATVFGLEESEDEVRESAFNEESRRSRVQRELKAPLARTNRAAQKKDLKSERERVVAEIGGTYAKKPPLEEPVRMSVLQMWLWRTEV